MKKAEIRNMVLGLAVPVTMVGGIATAFPARAAQSPVSLYQMETEGTAEDFEESARSAGALIVTDSPSGWAAVLNRERLGREIVMKVTGTAENSIDGIDQTGHYISYEGVKNVKVGDEIVTFFRYSEEGQDVDEIEERIDFVVDREK